MKTLFIDIETAPNVAYRWGLYDQSPTSLEQLVTPSYMLCFAAKWLGEKKVTFHSVREGQKEMLYEAHELLSEADVVVHWNGDQFDIPVMNREFYTTGMAPPAPSKQLDLYKTSKKQFAFPSHKLQYVSKVSGLEGKANHTGMSTWVGCMNGDDKSWKIMEKYNKQDVVLLEDLYKKMLPWITSHPNIALYEESAEAVCPTCGSADLRKEGFEYTLTAKYQRYQCRTCGRWSKSGKRVESVEIRGA